MEFLHGRNSPPKGRAKIAPLSCYLLYGERWPLARVAGFSNETELAKSHRLPQTYTTIMDVYVATTS